MLGLIAEIRRADRTQFTENERRVEVYMKHVNHELHFGMRPNSDCVLVPFLFSSISGSWCYYCRCVPSLLPPLFLAIRVYLSDYGRRVCNNSPNNDDSNGGIYLIVNFCPSHYESDPVTQLNGPKEMFVHRFRSCGKDSTVYPCLFCPLPFSLPFTICESQN